jgi:hypothetical protein
VDWHPVVVGVRLLGLHVEELEHGGSVRKHLAREPAPRSGVDPGVAALVLRGLLGEHGEQLKHGGRRQVRHPCEEPVDAALGAERKRGERQADLREQLPRRRSGAESPRGVEERVEELPRARGQRRRVGLDLPAEHLGGEEEEVGGQGRVGCGEEGRGHRPRLRGPLQGEEPLVGGEAGGRVRAVVERVDGRGQESLELRRLGGVHLPRRRRKAGRRGGWGGFGCGRRGDGGDWAEWHAVTHGRVRDAGFSYIFF